MPCIRKRLALKLTDSQEHLYSRHPHEATQTGQMECIGPKA
ncbi:hypothetical protein DEV91_11515 [Phyllobacterium brassicacearum]|nr:hypothetical protein DEV91_11515 [Phyllobacterium brassicacearum]